MLVDEDDEDEDEEEEDEEDDDEFDEFDESEAEFEPVADDFVPSSAAGADGGCPLVPVTPRESVVPVGAVTVPP
ncbi:hypothetical protein ABZT34_06895 [Streptomyces sp. NPDC005329]|uniref:hypothetical protein n=1 Tax=Streptomyces sp. NPDC005329 TaxID=3157034 RepID=UPI0033B7AEE5